MERLLIVSAPDPVHRLQDWRSPSGRSRRSACRGGETFRAPPSARSRQRRHCNAQQPAEPRESARSFQANRQKLELKGAPVRSQRSMLRSTRPACYDCPEVYRACGEGAQLIRCPRPLLPEPLHRLSRFAGRSGLRHQRWSWREMLDSKEAKPAQTDPAAKADRAQLAHCQPAPRTAERP